MACARRGAGDRAGRLARRSAPHSSAREGAPGPWHWRMSQGRVERLRWRRARRRRRRRRWAAVRVTEPSPVSQQAAFELASLLAKQTGPTPPPPSPARPLALHWQWRGAQAESPPSGEPSHEPLVGDATVTRPASPPPDGRRLLPPRFCAGGVLLVAAVAAPPRARHAARAPLDEMSVAPATPGRGRGPRRRRGRRGRRRRRRGAIWERVLQ